MLPADHLIRDVAAFHAAIGAAARIARRRLARHVRHPPPRSPRPATATSSAASRWPERTAATAWRGSSRSPDRETAARVRSNRQFSWNSGMFVFGARRLSRGTRALPADILDGRRARAGQARDRDLDFLRLDAEAFAACPADSIDYAVMEKTDRAAVLPIDIGWSDVGSWTALWEARREGRRRQRHARRRGPRGRAATATSARRAGWCRVLGVKNPIVVETDDAVLVADQVERAGRQGHRRAPRRREAQRARFAQPRLPAVGLVRIDRRRRPLPGEAHHGEARRGAVAADAPPPRRALGGRRGHREGDPRRRRDARCPRTSRRTSRSARSTGSRIPARCRCT